MTTEQLVIDVLLTAFGRTIEDIGAVTVRSYQE